MNYMMSLLLASKQTFLTPVNCSNAVEIFSRGSARHVHVFIDNYLSIVILHKLYFCRAGNANIGFAKNVAEINVSRRI